MRADAALRAVLRTTSEPLASAALLALRLYFGGALLLAHAWPKLAELGAGDPHFAALVARLGLPAPLAFAWAAALAQAIGSALAILGLGTRPASLLALSTLAIGIPAVHFGDPFPVVEAGLGYSAALTGLVLAGGGRYSIEAQVATAGQRMTTD